MKEAAFFIIHTLSNLHVGNGEGDFSVIDKRVQRDVLTKLPTINASSLKGALREAMEQAHHNGKIQKDDILEVFGGDAGKKKMKQGEYNFLNALLIAYPVRSTSELYYMATCQTLLDELIQHLENFDKTGKENDISSLRTLKEYCDDDKVYYFEGPEEGLQIEEWRATRHTRPISDKVKAYLGDRIALLPDTLFQELMEELPVIPRNYLNDGISESLWYEEVVPRATRFLMTILKDEGSNTLKDFLITDHRIQLGANATVGYGLCKLTPM